MEKAKTKQLKPEESAGSLAAEPRGDGESARVGAVGRPLVPAGATSECPMDLPGNSNVSAPCGDRVKAKLVSLTQ